MNHDAIFALYPNVVAITDLDGGTTDIRDADGNKVIVDEAQVNAWVDPKEYASKRGLEYPSIGDQLDMIYRAGLGGDEFQAAILAVKNKYPKPE